MATINIGHNRVKARADNFFDEIGVTTRRILLLVKSGNLSSESLDLLKILTPIASKNDLKEAVFE